MGGVFFYTRDMSEALIIIDIQNDYFPGGAMELVGAKEASSVAVQVKAHFAAKGKPVFVVQHIAGENASFFRPGTFGVELHESVSLNDTDVLIQKHYPNAFRETSLLEQLHSRLIRKISVVGMMTHMCIDTSVRAASDLGFEVTLISDACATRDLAFDGRTVRAVDVQAAYLAALNGSFASVVTLEEFRG